jgi:hypothetical protein
MLSYGDRRIQVESLNSHQALHFDCSIEGVTMRGMLLTIIALLACIVGLQLRLIDIATKASDRDVETNYQVRVLEQRSRDGTPWARAPERPFWDRLTSDE